MPDALVTLNQTIDSKYAANVLAFSNVTEDADQLQTMADDLRSSFAFDVVAHLSTSWTLDSITVAFIDVDHISFSVEIPFTEGQLIGQNIADVLPTQCAMLVSTSFVGAKPNRGRVYFAGLCENNTNGNVMNATVVTDFETLVESWRDGVSDAPDTVFLRIMGRPSPTRPSYLSSPVDLVTGRARIGTQRRRRRGGLS